MQSQRVTDWTIMLVYSQPEDSDDSVTNMWTKKSLISIREFEKDVRLVNGFTQVCLAEPVPGTTTE